MPKGLKGNQVPKAEGFGQKAGVGPVRNDRKSEQDGENRLLKPEEFMDRSRLLDNE